MRNAERTAEWVQAGFDAISDLYYRYWGEHFHLAIAGEDDDPADLSGCYERTHLRYFRAIGGPSRKRILELACGGGAFSAWLADRSGAAVVGVDRSETQLAHARRHYLSAERPNLSFRRADAGKLDLLDEPRFDAAVCLDAACYFPDRRAVLRGLAGMLEPGAPFLLVDWCRGDRQTALQRQLILEPLCRSWAIHKLETVAGYLKIFAAAGFDIQAVDDLSEVTAFNWERGYQLCLKALAEQPPLRQLVRPVASLAVHGVSPFDLARDQFQVALLSKAAADSGILRYVSFLVTKR